MCALPSAGSTDRGPSLYSLVPPDPSTPRPESLPSHLRIQRKRSLLACRRRNLRPHSWSSSSAPVEVTWRSVALGGMEWRLAEYVTLCFWKLRWFALAAKVRLHTNFEGTSSTLGFSSRPKLKRCEVCHYERREVCILPFFAKASPRYQPPITPSRALRWPTLTYGVRRQREGPGSFGLVQRVRGNRRSYFSCSHSVRRFLIGALGPSSTSPPCEQTALEAPPSSPPIPQIPEIPPYPQLLPRSHSPTSTSPSLRSSPRAPPPPNRRISSTSLPTHPPSSTPSTQSTLNVSLDPTRSFARLSTSAETVSSTVANALGASPRRRAEAMVPRE